MRLVRIIALAAFLIGAEPYAPFDHTKENPGEGDLIIFVGTEIFTQEASQRDRNRVDPVTGEEYLVLRMDSEWQSRFRILQRLEGTYENPTIDFTAFDHFGKPDYSEAKGPVLLYVREKPRGRFHDKYRFERVYQTTEGDWATCGSPFEELFDAQKFPYNLAGTETPPPLRDIIFSDPVQIKVGDHYQEYEFEGLTAEEVAEERAFIDAFNAEMDAKFHPPIYKRYDDLAVCKMGLPVSELVQHEIRTLYRYEDVETHCRRQVHAMKPLRHGGIETETYGDNQALLQSYETTLKTCLRKLYQSGWPYTD